MKNGKKKLYADGCSAENCAVWSTDLRLFCSLIYSTVYVFFCLFVFLFKFYYPPIVRKCTGWSGFSLLVHRTKATFPRWRKYINVNKKLSRSKCPIVQSDLNHHCNQNEASPFIIRLCSIFRFCERTVKTLIRLRECIGVSSLLLRNVAHNMSHKMVRILRTINGRTPVWL